MYAIVKMGGKQYKVAAGDIVKVNKIEADEGTEVTFNEVLALGDKIGTPLVKEASVKALVVKQGRDAKVIVFKKRRRQNYRRKNGHRQDITILRIVDVNGEKAAPKAVRPAAEKAETAKETKAPAKVKTVKTAKPAAKKPAAKSAKK